MQKARRRRWIAAALSATLALALGELVCRTSDALQPVARTYVGDFLGRPSAHFVADDEIGWRMRPDHRFSWPAPDGREVRYCADADGFRARCAPGPPDESPDGALRIAIVGDSQSWGAGVRYAETFGAVLGTELDATVRNFALPGFGLDQVGLALRTHALPWRPDVVVVGLFRADFDRSHESFRRVEGYAKPSFVLDGDRLRPRTRRDRPPAWIRWLDARSALFTLGEKTWRSVGTRLGIGGWWTLNAALLDRMLADAARASVQIIFVRIPHPAAEAFPALAEHLAARRATYVDPIVPAEHSALYFPDGHLNPTGQRRIAEALADGLRAHD